MDPRFSRKQNWRARALLPRHNFAFINELKERSSWTRSPSPTPKRPRGRNVSPASRTRLPPEIGKISPHPCLSHAYTCSSTPAAGIGPLIYHIGMPRQICDTPFCLCHICRGGLGGLTFLAYLMVGMAGGLLQLPGDPLSGTLIFPMHVFHNLARSPMP